MENTDNNKYKNIVIIILGVALSLFHLYTGFFGLLLGMYQRAIHFGFILTMCFLIFPATKNKRINKYSNLLDVFLALLAVIAAVYIVVNYFEIIGRLGMSTQADTVLGIITTLLTLEAVRRTCGLALFLVAIVGILFAYLGPYMPLGLIHRGYSFERIASYMYLTTEGIYGLPLGVAGTFIILFIIFGELLRATGAGEFLLDLAYSITAWSRGGPAKSAVIASGFFGTISGSAMANVVTTGTFTIPLMIRTGYRPVFAAAVEATASTGGLIAPPIMGSAAFIMAEMLNLPYINIVIAAIIPALLYYSSIFFAVDLQAQKLNLKGIPREELKSVKVIMLSGFEYIIPIALLVYFLFLQWSPATAVALAILALLITSFFRKKHRLTLRTFLMALTDGAKIAIPVSAACAAAGIVMGVIAMTGIGLRFSSIVINAAGGSLILALIFTMTASLILGMGMPSSACYIVLAVLAAPALIEMGVDTLAAHFYIFYYGVLSNITPPVALAAYTAAGISRTSNMAVAVQSCKLGAVAFIVPFMFVYGPGLLFQGEAIDIARNFGTALVGTFVMAIVTIGWFNGPRNVFERLVCFGIAMGLIHPGVISDIIGFIVLVLLVGAYFYKRQKKRPSDLVH